MRTRPRNGFTMLEIVVSIFLFSVGAFGYAALTTRMARAFLINSQRARSAELIHSRREILFRDGCSRISSGSETRFGIPLRWDRESGTDGRVITRIVTTRSGALQAQRDSIRTSVPCM